MKRRIPSQIDERERISVAHAPVDSVTHGVVHVRKTRVLRVATRARNRAVARQNWVVKQFSSQPKTRFRLPIFYEIVLGGSKIWRLNEIRIFNF